MSILLPGQAFPAFSLPGDDGKVISSDNLVGRPLALFFYPKADTQACTAEAVAFSALAAAFAAAGTGLLGISADTPRKLANFRRKYDLKTALAGDAGHVLLEACGLWVEKQMFGHRYMGIERTTVLLDRRGHVAQLWEKVKVAGHAEEVLAAARALSPA